MIIALWIIVPIVTYLFVAGMLRKPFAKVSVTTCKRCVDGNHNWVDTSGYSRRDMSKPSALYHSDEGAYRAAFWPFTLPWTLGTIATGTDRAGKKALRTQTRRADEIAEQEHQVELARLRKKENDLLDQHLKLAEIKGRTQDA